MKRFWIVKQSPQERNGTLSTAASHICTSLEEACERAIYRAAQDRRTYVVMEAVKCYGLPKPTEIPIEPAEPPRKRPEKTREKTRGKK
jgi:hypothetical protein